MAQPAVTPTLKPSSRAELERKKKGVVARGPSGALYRIRKPNLARYLEAGALPTELRRLALRAVNSELGSGPAAQMTEEDLEAMSAAREQQRAYHDRLVLATVIEPPLKPEDLGSGELEDDPFLPAVDYEWLLAVAQGSEQRDAEDRMLWGPEPRSRMEIFQRHHECAEDCEACGRVVAEFSAYLPA